MAGSERTTSEDAGLPLDRLRQCSMLARLLHLALVQAVSGSPERECSGDPRAWMKTLFPMASALLAVDRVQGCVPRVVCWKEEMDVVLVETAFRELERSGLVVRGPRTAQITHAGLDAFLRAWPGFRLEGLDQAEFRVAPGGEAHPCDAALEERVFEWWKKCTERGNQTKLTPARRALIRRAVQAYGAKQVAKAIKGCAIRPWNAGQNDRGERYDGLELILRSAEKIEQYIDYYESHHDAPEETT